MIVIQIKFDVMYSDKKCYGVANSRFCGTNKEDFDISGRISNTSPLIKAYGVVVVTMYDFIEN